MDLSTLILGIIFLMLMVVPLWLLIRSGKKRKEKMKKLIDELGRKYQLNFEIHESWNDKVIAIDPKRKWLAYAVSSDAGVKEQLIDLSKVLRCELTRQTAGKNGNDAPAIVRVELRLLHKFQEGQRENIILFDVERDDPIEGGYHYLIATKWQKRIADCIAGKVEVQVA